MRILEVIEKTTNLNQDNIGLTLLDTKLTQFTKLISATLTGTILTDDLDGIVFNEDLMVNIKYRQDKIDTTLSNAETEAVTLGITLIYTPVFTTLPTTSISVGDPIDYSLLLLIVTNEKDFYRRRLQLEEGYKSINVQLLPSGTEIQFNEFFNGIDNSIQSYNVSDNNFQIEEHHKYLWSKIPEEYWDYERFEDDNLDFYLNLDQLLKEYILDFDQLEELETMVYSSIPFSERKKQDLDYKIRSCY